MYKYERWLIYPALAILIIWVTLQGLELRVQHSVVVLQVKVLELHGKRLDLLEKLVIQSLSPLPKEE